MSDDKKVESNKSEVMSDIKGFVLKYVVDGQKICLPKAKEVIDILNTITMGVKDAAKKQINEEQAVLEATVKNFE